MKALVNWFATNSVAANLLMCLLVAGGLSTAFLTLRREQFPTVPPDKISISVSYPGASPEEVEESICVKIEEAVQSVDGVKRIVSKADEHIGRVTVEVLDGADLSEVLDDVKAKIDQINTFPEDTEEPVVQQQEVNERVISLAVRGDTDERNLKVLIDEVRDELLALPGITKVEVEDARPYEISIECREEVMRRYQLNFLDLARAVGNSSLNLPAGSVRTEGGEILFRSSAQAYTRDQFERIPIRTTADGTQLYVEDVAIVRHAFQDIDLEAEIDGKPSLLCQVYRAENQDTPTIAKRVHEYVAKKQKELPSSVDLIVWQDESVALDERMAMLKRNGLQGLVLVLLTLALFLKARLAIWVAAGLVTALLGAIWLMPAIGLSLNFLSSFGLILVLGILVDDAIVVAENVDAHRRMGKSRRQAAIDGTLEVMIPVGLAVVTTGIAFSPMLSMPGNMGKFTSNIALVVILSITFSLTEALLILPCHLAHEPHPPKGKRPAIIALPIAAITALLAPMRRAYERIQGYCSDLLDRFITRRYQPVLEFAIRQRYAVLAFGVAFLIVTGGLLAGGHLKFSFFPAIEGNRVIAAVRLPDGSSADQTRRAVAILEETADAVREGFARETGDIVRHIRSSVGAQRGTALSGSPHDAVTSDNKGHLGEVHVELTPSETRTVTGRQVIERWRKAIGDRLSDVEELTFSSSRVDAGSPINVELSGPDFDELMVAADQLQNRLESYAGTFNIANDHRAGKLEVAIEVSPAGMALGLTQRDLASQVRWGFYGHEVQRVQLGKDNVRVFVRYDRDERRSLANLENVRIRLADGSEVPFAEVASYHVTRGAATIQRIDRRRTIVVTCDLDRSVSNANEINKDLMAGFLPDLANRFNGLSYSLGGEQSRQSESMGSLFAGMGLALFLMFAVLAVVFRSYIQPLIVLAAIPFGFAGAIWAHWAFGMDLTFLSMIGFLALMGVVVNDSLVLIEFINRYRNQGKHSAFDAVRAAGPRRFRAILLTSLTTFAGLLPILLERSMQAEFVIPMAVSLAFGVALATGVILLLVPTMYLAIEDIKCWLGIEVAPVVPGHGDEGSETGAELEPVAPIA